MNLSLKDKDAEMLLVSQFTLYGDARRGRRPSYIRAVAPDTAREMFALFAGICKEKHPRTQTGVCPAMMDVELVNDGPVTILLDSKKEF
jgi:D-tyrosyl-tRNA(Tyr) deacylase